MEIQDKRYGDFFGSSDLGDATDGAGRLGTVAGAPDDPLPTPKAKSASVRLGTRLTMRCGATLFELYLRPL